MNTFLAKMSADEYFGDPWVEGPSLNATVAASLVLETPAHAREKHPRLCTNAYKRNTDALDEGTAIHQMLLGDDRCDILPFDSFRTKDAKEARDASRAAGRTPILQHKWDELLGLGESLKRQVAGWPIDPPLFVDGWAEQTVLWRDDRCRYRARLDWLRTDLTTIDDLKKARSAQHRRFENAIWGYGYDVKAAFYIRAVRAAFPELEQDPVFRWVAIEPTPPYAMSVHVLSPAAMRDAQAKLDLAIDLWCECLETGVWPAYGDQTNVIELPPWRDAVEWDDTAMTGVPF